MSNQKALSIRGGKSVISRMSISEAVCYFFFPERMIQRLTEVGALKLDDIKR